ncbi:MAG: hypothetical protein JWM11_4180 [Planctomycetaceae bacterium]|nr:hypothetical protein [Planctomycetaceae bacterium]
MAGMGGLIDSAEWQAANGNLAGQITALQSLLVGDITA